MLTADPLTTSALHNPVLDLAFFQTCNPASLYAADYARSFDRTVQTIRCQPSALWEDHLQSFNDQLNPTVFLDWQQADNFRTSSNDDGNDSGSGGIHNGIAFPLVYGDHLRLPTVISICLTRLSRSDNRSLLSFFSS